MNRFILFFLLCPSFLSCQLAPSPKPAGKAQKTKESAVSHTPASAYARHQHCSEKAARNLLVSGW